MTTQNATGPANPLLDWALYLAAMGWAVFPLAPMTKRQPAVKDWENRATTDPDRIRRCWSVDRWNIGVATGPSGLVVVDLDMPKDGDTGPDGPTALAALAAERGGPVPDTYTVTTPSGGTCTSLPRPEFTYATPKATSARMSTPAPEAAMSSDRDRCSRTADTSWTTRPTPSNSRRGWSKPVPNAPLRRSQRPL
jgi:hypothetical protein